MSTTTYPAFVEVFGEDGELFPVLIKDASDEELESGIKILAERRDAIDADIRALQAVLRERGAHPGEAAIREQSRQHSIDATVAFFRRSRT
jgi:hypothetical protein